MDTQYANTKQIGLVPGATVDSRIPDRSPEGIVRQRIAMFNGYITDAERSIDDAKASIIGYREALQVWEAALAKLERPL